MVGDITRENPIVAQISCVCVEGREDGVGRRARGIRLEITAVTRDERSSAGSFEFGDPFWPAGQIERLLAAPCVPVTRSHRKHLSRLSPRFFARVPNGAVSTTLRSEPPPPTPNAVAPFFFFFVVLHLSRPTRMYDHYRLVFFGRHFLLIYWRVNNAAPSNPFALGATRFSISEKLEIVWGLFSSAI